MSISPGKFGPGAKISCPNGIGYFFRWAMSVKMSLLGRFGWFRSGGLLHGMVYFGFWSTGPLQEPYGLPLKEGTVRRSGTILTMCSGEGSVVQRNDHDDAIPMKLHSELLLTDTNSIYIYIHYVLVPFKIYNFKYAIHSRNNESHVSDATFHGSKPKRCQSIYPNTLP